MRRLGLRRTRAIDQPGALNLLEDLRLARETGALTYEPFIHEELRRVHEESQLQEALRLYQAIGATGHARRLEAELA